MKLSRLDCPSCQTSSLFLHFTCTHCGWSKPWPDELMNEAKYNRLLNLRLKSQKGARRKNLGI